MKIGIFQTLSKFFHHKDEDGFSLLEVVVALGTLSMMLLVVYEVSLGGLRRVETAKENLLALALAQSLMDEQLALSVWRVEKKVGKTANLPWKKAIVFYEQQEENKKPEEHQLMHLRIDVNDRVTLQTLKRIEVVE